MERIRAARQSIARNIPTRQFVSERTRKMTKRGIIGSVVALGIFIACVVGLVKIMTPEEEPTISTAKKGGNFGRWVPEGVLVGAPLNNTFFGSSVSICEDRLVVGAPGTYDGADTIGSEAYVFGLNELSGQWELEGNLPIDNTSQFGNDVFCYGDLTIVGSAATRSAHVFQRTESPVPDPITNATEIEVSYALLTTLQGGDVSQDPNFGQSLESCMTSDGKRYIVVGSPLDGTTNQGSVHIFEDQGGNFASMLVSRDNSIQLGHDVKCSGDLIAAKGKHNGDGSFGIHLLKYSEPNWVDMNAIEFPNGINLEVGSFDVDGNTTTLVIGDPTFDGEVGAVFVFNATENPMTLMQKIGGVENIPDRFGEHVDIRDDILLVRTQDSKIHQYSLIDDVWVKQDDVELVFSGPVQSVAQTNDRLIVGIPSVNNNTGEASVMYFQPTAAPTVSPTSAPTLSPTFAPTFSPTLSPTQAPTYVPSFSPTISPTLAPTSSPTETPLHKQPGPMVGIVLGGVVALAGLSFVYSTVSMVARRFGNARLPRGGNPHGDRNEVYKSHYSTSWSSVSSASVNSMRSENPLYV